jgi:hypothetical protein
MKLLPFIGPLLIMYPVGTSYAQDNSGYDVVSEYVRELGVMENLRNQALEKMNGDAGNNKALIEDFVQLGKSEIVELKSDIEFFRKVRLNADLYNPLIPEVIDIYQQKVALYSKMKEEGEEFLEAPKKGKISSETVARMKSTWVEIDQLDSRLWGDTVELFASLLIDVQRDEKERNKKDTWPDLNISKAQRQKLIDTINREFGKKIDEPGEDRYARIASEFQSFLTQAPKCSDDP